MTVYRYAWNRMGRKGQLCRVLVRGKRNSCLVEFADGFKAVTSRNALRKVAACSWCNRPAIYRLGEGKLACEEHVVAPVSFPTELSPNNHQVSGASARSDSKDGAGDGDRTRDIQLGKLATE